MQKECKQLQQQKNRSDKNLRHTFSTTYSCLPNKHVRQDQCEKCNMIHFILAYYTKFRDGARSESRRGQVVILPKSGWAYAHPAHPLLPPLSYFRLKFKPTITNVGMKLSLNQ